LISSDVEYAYQIEAVCLCKILQVINDELKHIEREMNRITDAGKNIEGVLYLFLLLNALKVAH